MKKATLLLLLSAFPALSADYPPLPPGQPTVWCVMQANGDLVATRNIEIAPSGDRVQYVIYTPIHPPQPGDIFSSGFDGCF